MLVIVIGIAGFSYYALFPSRVQDLENNITKNGTITSNVTGIPFVAPANDTSNNTSTTSQPSAPSPPPTSPPASNQNSTTIPPVIENNQQPIADAGESITINEGAMVILRGSTSSDPDGDALSYSWKQSSGQPVSLSNPDSVTPLFTAPEITDSKENIKLTFDLTVTDSNGGSDSDSVDVTVLNVIDNQAPIANAGPDQNASEGSIVTLQGSNSTDSDGDELTYSWKQIGGESIEFSPTSLNPTFAAPIIEVANSTNSTVTLTFELTVDDGNGGLDSDISIVTVYNVVQNRPPIADAGSSQTIEGSKLVTLNGTGSSDPDGDPLTFSWNQTTGPSVSLKNNNSSSPTFQVPDVTKNEQLTFELEVSDGNKTSTDSVNIYAIPPEATHAILATPDYMNDVASEISKAKKFVYAVMYFAEPYPGNKIVDALEAAKTRGVDVRLTFDNETLELYPTVEKDFAARGIPYKVISNHAKVVVIDNATAYVGSANWNKNGLENNWELSLKTKNPDSVSEAYQFVNIMWETGAKKVNNTEKSERFANGLEFYNLLLQSVQSAHSIKTLMFQITYHPLDPQAVDTKLMNEIKSAKDRGVNLQILLDDPTYYGPGGGRDFIVKNSIPVRLDEKNTGYLERLHAKAVLIDDKILFIGSQNWNYDSLDSPQEASIVTSDPQVIADFLDIFNEKWNAGHKPT